MDFLEHIRLMASYNTWMNNKIHESTGRLSDEEISSDRKAFFRSILGTLNHLIVADTIWLARFATHPAQYAALQPIQQHPSPTHLDQILFSNIRDLTVHRRKLDAIITEWSQAITEADLEHTLHYVNSRGEQCAKNFFSILMHFFNHQTHHRGQVSTLLSQAGIAIGITDLIVLTPDKAITA